MASVLLATFFMVACGDGGPTGPLPPTTPTPVIPEAQEITISVELPYPEDDYNIRVGISEVTVTCVGGCESQQTEVTNHQGEVTFTGRPPLTIRAEKSGHIPVEQRVYGGGRVNMGHEWPPELRVAIRQLDLASAIAAGELFLIWGDEEHIEATMRRTGNDDIAGDFRCSVVIIRQLPRRDVMVRVLAHELMHAWQGRKSNNPPCDIHHGYAPSTEGKAWAEARDKDLREKGPYPGFDGETWSSSIWENQAEVYARWY